MRNTGTPYDINNKNLTIPSRLAQHASAENVKNVHAVVVRNCRNHGVSNCGLSTELCRVNLSAQNPKTNVTLHRGRRLQHISCCTEKRATPRNYFESQKCCCCDVSVWRRCHISNTSHRCRRGQTLIALSADITIILEWPLRCDSDARIVISPPCA